MFGSLLWLQMLIRDPLKEMYPQSHTPVFSIIDAVYGWLLLYCSTFRFPPEWLLCSPSRDICDNMPGIPPFGTQNYLTAANLALLVFSDYRFSPSPSRSVPINSCLSNCSHSLLPEATFFERSEVHRGDQSRLSWSTRSSHDRARWNHKWSQKESSKWHERLSS